MAIVHGSVRVVEEPRLRNQISKLGATEAVLLPVDAGRRASPVHVFEQGPGPLGEFPVKCRVVRNDDLRVGDEILECGIIDLVPGNHLIRDAGQLDDLLRDRDRRLVESLENVGDTDDLIAVRIVEFDHCHFDNFVLLWVKTGGLEIDDDPDLVTATGGSRGGLLRKKAAQDPVVAGGLEPAGNVFGFFVSIVHGGYLGVGR